MTLSKHTEVAEVIKHSLSGDLLAGEVRPIIETLDYFIQLVEKLEEEGIAQVIKNNIGNEYTYDTIAYKQAIELSQAILSFLLDNEN